MAAILIINIKQLVNTRTQHKLLRGKELAILPCIENAWLLMVSLRVSGQWMICPLQAMNIR